MTKQSGQTGPRKSAVPYSQNEYLFLGRQVAEGKYVRYSTFLLSLALALLVGMAVGRYLLPADAFRLPAPDPNQARPADPAANADPKILANLLRHEEELRRNPDNAEAWTHMGNLYYDAGEAEKAIRAYERSLTLAPDAPDVLVDCGVMYRKIKNYTKSLEYFAQALAISPGHEIALFNTGIVLYYDLQRREEGVDAWRKLARINPQAKSPQGRPVVDMIKDYEAGKL
jgi:cytochrome c-type biogenesis protein CcmH/NrfG